MRVFEWGKAKVLSKKPRRTFISLKPGVGFNVIHHDLNEQATLPTVLPPCQSSKKKKNLFFLCWTCEDLSNKESMCAFMGFTVVHCEIWDIIWVLVQHQVINITLSRNWQTCMNCALQLNLMWYSKKICISLWDGAPEVDCLFLFCVIYMERILSVILL